MVSRAQARSTETVAHDIHDGTPNPQRIIRRSRTGCFTCRKRRKKCDERKPECANCKRGNIHCEFESKQKWEQKNAANKARKEIAQRQINVELRPLFKSYPGPSGIYSNVLPFQTPAFSQTDTIAFSNQDYGMGFYGTGMGHFGTESNYDLQCIGLNTPDTDAAVFENYQEPQNDVQVLIAQMEESFPENSGLIHTAVQEFEFMPAELPFLINGIDTAIHKRLFLHFTNELSHLLTTSSGDSNPINSEVIPLAMRDSTVMKTVLCLAACHLLKKRHTVDVEIFQEKERLHEEVCTEQKRRVPLLHQYSRGLAALPLSVSNQEIIFATSLLLCLYEICEGTGNSSWKTHLDVAREALTMGPRSPGSDSSDDGDPETIVTEINPFLLEFFIYHDSLATVTMSSPPSPKPRFQGSPNCSPHDPSMIGVNDGLCDFVTRISTIRAEADASPRKPDGKVVEKAVRIFEDLERWRPKDMSPEWRLIAQFYQSALVIWLFSIVYPHEKEHFKVQNAVQRVARLMKQIKSGDGVMSCLLFPLFVIGTAAVQDEDRSAISFHFKRLKDWSSLGNIDLAEGVVQKMWSDHDMRKPDSWDWVKQLESRNLSILIT